MLSGESRARRNHATPGGQLAPVRHDCVRAARRRTPGSRGKCRTGVLHLGRRAEYVLWNHMLAFRARLWCKRLTRSILAALTLGCATPDARRLAAAEHSAGWEIREIGHSQPAARLSYVLSLAADGRGRVYVGDWSVPGITVLSPAGELLPRLGREGEGPGEFRRVSQLAVLPNDTLLVFDAQLQRLTLFTVAPPRLVRTTLLGPRDAGFPSAVYPAGSGGDLVAVYRRPQMADRATDPRQDQVVLALLRADGSLLKDSLAVFPVDERLIARHEGSVAVRIHPFGIRTFVQVRDSVVYWIRSDTAVVFRRTIAGTTLAPLIVASARARITPEQFADTLASLQAVFRPVLEKERTARSHWPAVADLLVDEQHRLWLGTLPHPGQGVEWLVLDTNGREMGRVTMPARERLRAVRDSTLYAVRLDEDDVPTVVTYRLTASLEHPER